MKLKVISLIVSLLYLPFSLFLTYNILLRVEATELMWFLFWMLVPWSIIVGILSKLADWEGKE